ncbi:class I tRNA ligase family protein [Staphylococcus aureus]
MTKETVNHVADLFAEHGSNISLKEKRKTYYQKDLHIQAALTVVAKETNIMDVWFDSGSSHRGVLETRPELSFPADMS